MSANSIQEFLTKVSEDQALQEELAKAMESENDREAVTELAKSKGYEFTAEELGSAIDQIQAEAQQQMDASELSEEELESVAGGATPVITTVATIKISVATGSAVSALSAASFKNPPRW